MVIRCKHNFFMYIVYIIKSQNTLLTPKMKGKVGKSWSRSIFFIQLLISSSRLNKLPLDLNWLSCQKIDCHFPSFSELPSSSFTGMLSGLESLNLEHCSLRNLVLKDEVVVKLNLLQLEGNPLHCDCHARWLWNLAKNNTKITIRLPNCQSPFSAKGIPLQKLPGIKKN